MIFTYFELINICSPYRFVDILMTEILKVVEKVKFITIKGPKRSLEARHVTKKFAWVARIIDTFQASLRIDVDHMKVNRFT